MPAVLSHRKRKVLETKKQLPLFPVGELDKEDTDPGYPTNSAVLLRGLTHVPGTGKGLEIRRALKTLLQQLGRAQGKQGAAEPRTLLLQGRGRPGKRDRIRSKIRFTNEAHGRSNFAITHSLSSLTDFPDIGLKRRRKKIQCVCLEALRAPSAGGV